MAIVFITGPAIFEVQCNGFTSSINFDSHTSVIFTGQTPVLLVWCVRALLDRYTLRSQSLETTCCHLGQPVCGYKALT